MYAKHTIFYDKLPEYFLAFDAFLTRENRWLNYEERNQLCCDIGFHQVPLVNSGIFRKEDLAGLIPAISKYGSEPAEGIVVKRYKSTVTNCRRN